MEGQRQTFWFVVLMFRAFLQGIWKGPLCKYPGACQDWGTEPLFPSASRCLRLALIGFTQQWSEAGSLWACESSGEGQGFCMFGVLPIPTTKPLNARLGSTLDICSPCTVMVVLTCHFTGTSLHSSLLLAPVITSVYSSITFQCTVEHSIGWLN